MKIDDFEGELTDISAKKEALVVSHRSVHGVCVETEVALDTRARSEGVVGPLGDTTIAAIRELRFQHADLHQ